jgi:hypothetical protein
MGSLKGGEYERELSRTISLWWSQDNPLCPEPDDLIFWRSTQSGGRATTRAKKGKKADLHCADLCAINPIGEPLLKVLLIESKRGYPKATLNLLIDKPDTKKSVDLDSYEQWFAKAEVDRQRSGALYWAIIHRRDGRQALMITQEKFLHSLPTKTLLSLGLGGPSAYLYSETGVFVVLLFKDFLRAVKPNDILGILQESKNLEESQKGVSQTDGSAINKESKV